jgi:YVTN family beta-propeller protein
MQMRFGSLCVLLFCLVPLIALSAEVDRAGEDSWMPVPVERGETLNRFFTAYMPETVQVDIDPGQSPEGDYMGQVTYTLNGDRVLLTNRLTDNLTVFDPSTMDVLENIHVGRYPGGLAVSDSYAVLTLGFSDSVVVIDLDGYSIASRFATGEQPWVVRTSRGGSRAYVSCDIDDVCEVIDLDSMTHVMTIPDFPIALASFSFNSENGRNSFVFTDFELTPDGQHIIVGGYRDSVFFYNTTTGAVDYVIPDIPSCTSIELSGNDSIAVALSNTNPVAVHQIDLATHTKTAEVTVTGYSISISLDLGVNYDGSKAFISVSNNSSAIVRFATSDFVILTETLSPFWIGTSPDHSLAISGQYHFSIVDFASEAFLGEHAGNAQHTGAISPVGSLAVGFDAARHEGLYFYDYTNTSTPQYMGTTNAGLDPEGDAPRRVAMTPDGSKSVVTNVLSDNATVIDLSSNTVEAIVPIGDRVQNLSITSDSRYAVICGFNSNSVKVLDLYTDSVVADVPTNTRAGVISLTPDDEYAYVGNIQANTISVVKLDSSASAEVAELPCGVIGVVWAAYGVSSDVEVSPTGEYTLVATSFDDVVQVIDNASNAIVASPAVGDFPIQIAFDTTGEYAIATNYFSSTYSVIYVEGESSAVVAEPSAGTDTRPLRLATNPVTNEIGIGLYSANRVLNVDPQTGNVNSTDYYTGYGGLIQLEFGESGDPIVLTGSDGTTPGHLHRFGQAIPLPAVPSYFDYCPVAQKACVVMPGPDYVTVIEWLGPAIKEVVTIPLEPSFVMREPRPNPFCSETMIRFLLHDDCDVVVSVHDRSGREVVRLLDSGLERGEHTISWNGRDSSGREVRSGVYFVDIKTGERSESRKVVVLR